MGRVGVEEAATVRAQHLDRLLRGDRPLRDELLEPLDASHLGVGVEVLWHALPDEEERKDDADRQQDVEDAARQIHPEVAEVPPAAPREPTDDRDRQHDADGGGGEVVEGETSHLRQIAHRGLATVVLPVGVRREADGGVEGQHRVHRHLPLRIERQESSGARSNAVEQQHAGRAEEQHRDGVDLPVLLALLVHTAHPVDDALDGPQHWREPGAPSREDRGEVQPHRLGDEQQQEKIDGDLRDAVERKRHLMTWLSIPVSTPYQFLSPGTRSRI